MKTRGRNICNTLKAIRKQIADANGIDYSPEECHFGGECMGTCSKCEQDVSYLERELRLRQMAGKAVKIAGIAAGLVVIAACSDGKPQRTVDKTAADNTNVEVQAPPDTSELTGDIRLLHSDKKKLTSEEESLVDGEISNNSPVDIIKEPISSNGTDCAHSKKQKQVKISVNKSAIGAKSAEDSKTFGAAEEMATFPGGQAAYMKFIAENLRFPENSVEGVATGRVMVCFVVNEDGALSDIKVVRHLAPDYDEEAIRVVKLMPKWNPGKLNGNVVKTKCVVPVKFFLE